MSSSIENLGKTSEHHGSGPCHAPMPLLARAPAPDAVDDKTAGAAGDDGDGDTTTNSYPGADFPVRPGPPR